MKFSMRISMLAALALASVAAAKPLYITVPRAYGPSEPVAVDVAFNSKGPVELRVLKPDNLNAFIQAQGDIRRAYEEPPVLKNPGRALSRGLNAVRLPTTYLLYSFSTEFRDMVAPALPQRGPEDTALSLNQLAEGPDKLIGVPPGFSVVRSQWLNLDLGGDRKSVV